MQAKQYWGKDHVVTTERERDGECKRKWIVLDYQMVENRGGSREVKCRRKR